MRHCRRRARRLTLGCLAPQSFSSTATLDDPNKHALLDSLPPHLNEYEGFTTTCTTLSPESLPTALDPIPVLNDELGSRWVMSAADTAGRLYSHRRPFQSPFPVLQLIRCRPTSLYTGRLGFSLPHRAARIRFARDRATPLTDRLLRERRCSQDI
ncbi:hypothetical protein ARMSODRAFT_963332 [Armillaria solidipes]|uniref:Uncharacterized protein n=1 Tax=Armillaria solidipes TaxID=1076256 RepID=A0A2H3BH27_9AGAR|nr:hypothetical protein ARMSODRAFT_963332 [Armillaria solidipes]